MTARTPTVGNTEYVRKHRAKRDVCKRKNQANSTTSATSPTGTGSGSGSSSGSENTSLPVSTGAGGRLEVLGSGMATVVMVGMSVGMGLYL